MYQFQATCRLAESGSDKTDMGSQIETGKEGSWRVGGRGIAGETIESRLGGCDGSACGIRREAVVPIDCVENVLGSR